MRNFETFTFELHTTNILYMDQIQDSIKYPILNNQKSNLKNHCMILSILVLQENNFINAQTIFFCQLVFEKFDIHHYYLDHLTPRPTVFFVTTKMMTSTTVSPRMTT